MRKICNSRIMRTALISLVIFMFLFNTVSQATPLLEIGDMKEFLHRGTVNTGKFNGIGQGRNLIVLQIDSLQNTFINYKYNGQELTPNLNDLANNSSIYFNNYYENIGKGDSGDAEFVSNNSYYPDRDTISYEKYFENDYYGMPKYLKANNYNTYLFANSRRNKFSRDKAYKSQGYDEYFSKEDFQNSKEIGYSLDDKDFFKNIVEKMKTFDKDKNFYAYITNGTSQKPYVLPDEYKYLSIQDSHKNTRLEDYIHNIHYVDRQVGLLVEELKKAGIFQKSMFVVQGSSHAITAENTNLNNMMTELLGRTYDYREMMKVPLIVYHPNLGQGYPINNIGSHLDFYPTLASLMGYKGYDNMVAGIDILNHNGYRPISIDKYRPKSYFDNEKLFLMANDGVFENSGGKSLLTGANIPLEKFKYGYEYLDREMRNSEFVLDNNLMTEIIDTGFITLKPEMNTDYLVKIDNILIKDMETVYNKGHRYFTFDIDNFQHLIPIVYTYKDIYHLITVDNTNFNKLKDIKEELRPRVTVEIKNEDIYWPVINMGYENVILNLEVDSMNESADKALINRKSQILDRYTALIFNKASMNSEFYKEVKDDIQVINRQYDAELTRSLMNRKVDTIITGYKDVLNTLIRREVQNKHVIAHAGGKLEGQTYTNALQAVEKSYEQGIRLMEVDFQWTTDGRLVSTHSWDGFINLFFNVPVKRYSYNEFVNFEMINGWDQLYPELLERWFNEYPEVYLVSDIKSDNIKALKILKDKYPFLIDKMIPQVYNLNEYKEAEKLGFKNIILTLYRTNESNDTIVEFGKEKRPFGITMPISRAKTGLPMRLKNEGVFTYVHTINDMDKVNEMEDLGITGIYTDEITP